MTSTAAPQTWSSAPLEDRLGGRRWPLDAVLVAVLTGVAVLLRAGALGPSSLWLDDAWVALVIRTESLTELRYVGFSAPGFALLLRTWLGMVGFSETAAQALPFAAGVIAPATTYLVGRRLAWHRATAVVPALVLAFSPMAMEYATRVKQYTTESLLAVGLLGLAFHLLDDVRSPRRWTMFAVAAAVATTVSAFLAPYAAAGVAAGLVRALLDRDRAAVRSAAVAGLGYGVFAALWYLSVLAPAVTTSISAFWIGHYLSVTEGFGPATASLWSAVTQVVTGLSALPVVVTLVALLVAGVVVAIRRVDVAVLLATPSLVAAVLAAAQVAPLGGGRTDIFLYPSLALLIGAGLDVLLGARVRPGRGRTGGVGGWGIAALTAVALAVTAEPVTAYPRQDVRPLVDALEARRASGDAVLLYPATTWAYALYTSDEIDLAPDAGSSWGFSPRFADDATHALPPGREDPGAYTPTVERLATNTERLWLLASHWRDDYRDLQDQLGDAGFERTEFVERDGAQLSLWKRR